MEFTINLSENELNYILNILAEKPYIEVVELINKIQTQGSEQLQANE